VIKRNAEPEAVTAQAEKAETVKADTKADDSSNEIEYIYHTIQPGDTLWGNRQELPGVSVDDIKRLNGDPQHTPSQRGQEVESWCEQRVIPYLGFLPANPARSNRNA
jgi:LysM repeat protein